MEKNQMNFLANTIEEERIFSHVLYFHFYIKLVL